TGSARMISRPAHSLLETIQIAPDTKTDRVGRRACEAQLRHRNRILSRPAERVDSGRDIPDAVPASVLVVVVIDGVVALDAAGTHAELEAAAAVVIRIDHHDYLIRRWTHVPPRERGAYRGRILVECANEDVDVVAVVRNPELGAEARIRVFDRIVL